MALEAGLYKNLAFALLQDATAGYKVALAGPADMDAPVWVPARVTTQKTTVPIFMYHRIDTMATYSKENTLDKGLTVLNTDLDAQIKYMLKNDFHAITFTELYGFWYYGLQLPTKPMILSFDDGYKDVFTYGLPILMANHVRGVIYACAGFATYPGNRTADPWNNYMNWDNLKAMSRSGMEVESHTLVHDDLSTVSDARVQQTLTENKSQLETQLGIAIQFFCYPYGYPFSSKVQSTDREQLVLKDLFDDGYLGATLDLSFPNVGNSAQQISTNPYEQPRVRSSGSEPLETFIKILISVMS
jgi:peptidoglycan/xylan/chitin deacetylase (PgdA/CDA1 family)